MRPCPQILKLESREYNKSWQVNTWSFYDPKVVFFAGGIPMELGKLNQLQALNLQNNTLTGSISPSLGNPSSLQVSIRINRRHSG